METVVPCCQSLDDRCMIGPSREVRDRMLQRYRQLKQHIENSPELAFLNMILRPLEHRRPGFNDALVRPGHTFEPGLSFSSLLRERKPLRGDIRTIVVLVDFPDQKFNSSETTEHYAKLWFEKGTNSVHDFFNDVSHGLVSVVGDVVGPFRMPHDIRYYTNNRSGLGNSTPNGQTMAYDAAILADAKIDFTAYDNDQDGFVDSFVIVHAGPGAEKTGELYDMWSHKWVLDKGPYRADKTKIYSYLTIPGDCKLGVCAHELGHLAFGWPDLYDADYSSSGIGDWCLMAAGSYNGNEENPSPPSAWCKANQGWVDLITPKDKERVKLEDVKDGWKVVKIWKGAEFKSEYFLLENRQMKGRDADIPGKGLLMWHIDENKNDNTSEKTNYKVALVQSDGERDMELGENQGDDGDPFPGVKNIRVIDATTNPSTNANNRAATGIAINDISDAADVMYFSFSYGDLERIVSGG